jgi:hypothetical protein
LQRVSLCRVLLSGDSLVAVLDLDPCVWSKKNVRLVLTLYEAGLPVDAAERSFPDLLNAAVPVRSKMSAMKAASRLRSGESSSSSASSSDDDAYQKGSSLKDTKKLRRAVGAPAPAPAPPASATPAPAPPAPAAAIPYLDSSRTERASSVTELLKGFPGGLLPGVEDPDDEMLSSSLAAPPV